MKIAVFKIAISKQTSIKMCQKLKMIIDLRMSLPTITKGPNKYLGIVIEINSSSIDAFCLQMFHP